MQRLLVGADRLVSLTIFHKHLLLADTGFPPSAKRARIVQLVFFQLFFLIFFIILPEIYRIVSQKQIRDPPEGDVIRPTNVEPIDVKPTVSADSVRKQCCQ